MNQKKFLYIGRIRDKRSSFDYRDVKKMPDKRLVLAGIGNKLDELKNFAADCPNINFIGFMQKDELQKLLNKTKAVVVTSQWYETFGMIIVEAFASHVPVIVGNLGNTANLVDGVADGIKFQYNSASSLIQAVKRFEQLDVKKLGENAYMKYRKDYAQDSNYEVLNKIYSSISIGGYSLNLYSPKQLKESMLYTGFYTGKQVAA